MRPTRARSLARLALATLTTLAAACRDDPAGVDEGEARAYNPDWSRGSHGPVAPQYAVVFPQDSANTIEIRMTAAEWSSIRANVKQILRTDFGQGGMGGPIGPGGPGGFPGGGPAGGPAGGPSGGPGGDLPPLPNPDYVPVTVTFGGKRWRDVGFRLKGNSGLAAAWSQGSYKLPFRLDFDEFEDRVPATRDQRLHGFRELSFSPGTSDNSLVREKLAADVLRAAGVPAARAAFYRVYVDFGAGSSTAASTPPSR